MLNFIRTKNFFLEHFRLRGRGQLPCLLDQKNVLQKIKKHQYGRHFGTPIRRDTRDFGSLPTKMLFLCYTISQVLFCGGTSPEIKELLRYSDTYPLAQAHIYDSSRDTKNASFPVLRHTFLYLPTSRNLGADHHTLPNGKISC